METKTFDIDVACEGDELAGWLELVSKRFEDSWVRVIASSGSGSGWPMIKVQMPVDRLEEFADFYGADLEDLV